MTGRRPDATRVWYFYSWLVNRKTRELCGFTPDFFDVPIEPPGIVGEIRNFLDNFRRGTSDGDLPVSGAGVSSTDDVSQESFLYRFCTVFVPFLYRSDRPHHQTGRLSPVTSSVMVILPPGLARRFTLAILISSTTRIRGRLRSIRMASAVQLRKVTPIGKTPPRTIYGACPWLH